MTAVGLSALAAMASETDSKACPPTSQTVWTFTFISLNVLK